jgi:hypothetical protein
MLPCCIVINFFLNNKPDAPIIQIYPVIKLFMFGASSLPIIGSFVWKRSSKNCLKLASVEFTVENS